MAGVGCLFAGEKLRERDYGVTANALSGAGIIILYASVWAARVLYELIGTTPAYGLMILITIVCGLLSWRYRGLDIAMLGMIGGFLTPLLLSTGQDNPIGLFAYILLLDVGLLVLARARRWPLLGALSLGGTVLYQLLWIFGRMGPDRALLGLAILGVFAVFYGLAGHWGARRDEEGDPAEAALEQLTRGAAVLLPFAFGLYFAGRADFGAHLYPIGVLLLLLSGPGGLAEPRRSGAGPCDRGGFGKRGGRFCVDHSHALEYGSCLGSGGHIAGLGAGFPRSVGMDATRPCRG